MRAEGRDNGTNNELLKELYRKYYREICLYLFSLGHDRSLAEDLTQETFIKALLSLSDSHSNMRAWLYMVARNLFFDYVRKSKNETGLDDVFDEPSPTPEPPDELIKGEQMKTLYKALQNISANKREILLLQYFNNLKSDEIAAIMHLNASNVRVLAHRGKQEIKQYMEEHGYDL